MKIEKLMIYGFGKHENLTIDVEQPLSMFYGTNEAGKTTIQQFIVQTLFGYPTRNQALLRYEPKSGGKYGGQIHLQDPEYGRCIIERVKGKAAGDVTVFFEDGSRGSEEELRLILRGYDRASFESIFSFSIHELQGLERMTEEELSRTLLASGTTGVDAVTKMEDGLAKEMALLFKKTGRNPELNVLIEELRSSEKELKELQEQTQLYGPYIERIQEIDMQLKEMTEEEMTVSSELANAAKWQQAVPLMEKKMQLEKAIEELHVSSFPSDGRRRMDLLQDRLSETTAKMTHIEEEIAALPFNEQVSPDTNQLEVLLSKESEWHRMRSVLQQKEEELGKLEDDQERLLNLIGVTKEKALESDVSLNKEEQLVRLIQESDIEEEERRFRNRNLTEEKNRLLEKEKELAYLKSHGPSDQERITAQKWPEITVKLAEEKAMKRLQNRNNLNLVGGALAMFGLLGVVIGLLQRDFILAGLTFLAAIAGSWLIINGRKKESETTDLLNQYGGREAEFEALTKKVAEYDRSISDMERSIDLMKKKIIELSNDNGGSPAKEKYESFLEEIGMNPSASRAMVLDLFEKLREIHTLNSGILKVTDQIGELTREMDEWLNEASKACGKPVSAYDLYSVLRSEFTKRQQIKDEEVKIREKREDYNKEWKRLNIYSEQLGKERQNLLEEAGAEGVEDYYRLCEIWNRKEQLKMELFPIVSQLSAIGELEKPVEGEKGSIAEFVSNKENRLAELTEKRNELLSETAEKQQTIKSLLSDGSYDEKLQEFEEKKAYFNELALRWSIDKAITEAIKKTMAELKEKLLPSVIANAAQYFQKLTSDAYQGLELNTAGYFETVRRDGIRFHIIELSQATKEQAYLALRLSLAVSMQKSHPFPIIMDDPFVHFDRGRLQQMINLITELKKDHQFIYFTCHEDMRQAWPEAQIVEVETIERRVHL